MRDGSPKVSGACFAVAKDPLPIFLSCAHVLLDGHHRAEHPLLLSTGFGQPGSHPPRGVTILAVKPEIDAVLFRAMGEVHCKTVAFANSTDVANGLSVAALGCPLPSATEWFVAGADGLATGQLSVQLRLAAGWMSQDSAHARLPETLYTSPDLLHYELNMLGYPGISGGPLFNVSGEVIGMMRGTKLHAGQQVAPYAYADRLNEISEFLTENRTAS